MKTAIVIAAVAAAAWASFAQVAATPAAALNDTSYAVISAFLRSQLSGRNGVDDIRVGPHGSVLDSETILLGPSLAAAERNRLRDELRGLQEETLNSLAACSMAPVPFAANLSLPVAYQIVLPGETKSAEALYAKYPRTRGYVRFSCVGFNSSHTQALFFVERKMCRCGVGKFVMMRRNGTGMWVTAGEVERWIS